MKILSVVNSIALHESEVFVQSRLAKGINVYDLNGEWLRHLDVDSYFGWAIKIYNNQLYFGATDNSIKVFDLIINKVTHQIEPVWKIENTDQNFDGRYTVPTGFTIFDDEIFVIDTFDNKIICLSITGDQKYVKYLDEIIDIDARMVRIDVSSKNIVITCVETNLVLLLTKDFKVLKIINATGSNVGEFEVPWDIKILENEIYISDLYNHRIQVFDCNLIFIRSFGTWGTRLGEFNYVYGFDIQAEIAVFADTWNHGFQIWKQENGEFHPFKAVKSPDNMLLLRPNRIVRSNSNVIVSDYLNHCFKIFDKDIKECITTIGSLGFEVGQFRYPSGIVEYDKAYFCTDLRSGQVIKFENNMPSVFVAGHDGAPMSPNSEAFISSMNKESSVLRLASDITVDKNGNIYVADMGHLAILKFDRLGSLITSFGNDLIKVDNKTSLISCHVDSDVIYVTNPSLHEILIFNLDGSFLTKIEDLSMNTPTGIDVDDVFVAIADRLNHRVLILDKKNHSIIKEIGGIGNKPKCFCAPWDVCLNNKYLYVADSLNNRVQKIYIGELYA